MEIGSLASQKVLPIMADSLEILKYASNQEWLIDRNIMMDLFEDPNETVSPKIENHDKKYFLLIPSLNQLPDAMKSGVKNISFITSVSNTFQKKNVNRTLEETKSGFSEMFIQYPSLSKSYTKLYISCVRECPIAGPIDLHFIIKEILYYHSKYPFDEICLSDTCGTLTFDDFEFIVDTIYTFGVPYSKLSLHLHVNKDSTHIDSILRYCFKRGIRKFDVSLLHMGGCSITMSKETSHSNLSYNQFYEILKKYIELNE
jgi:hydroxymethylglutaryl-CoA lyase